MRYLVSVELSDVFEVEADTADEAEEIAIEQAKQNLWSPTEDAYVIGEPRESEE